MQTGSQGFTLVEMLVAVMLTCIAAVGMYQGFVSVTVAYNVQDQVVELQQSVRLATDQLARDIRMAGFDPNGSARAGITTADATRLVLTMDLNSDGIINPNETILNDLDGDGILDDNDTFNDANFNGILDAETIDYQFHDNTFVPAHHARTLCRNIVPVVQNVDAVNFVYLDAAGAVLATPVASPALIRSIQVAIVVRTSNEDYSYTNSDSYVQWTDLNRDGVRDAGEETQILAPQNDHFRRRLITIQVDCRNLGL